MSCIRFTYACLYAGGGNMSMNLCLSEDLSMVAAV